MHHKVSANLSAFLIDINQVAMAVHASSERSLILLDEFGKVILFRLI